MNTDLIGTWRHDVYAGQPLAPEQCREWVFRADGTAEVAHLGPCVWESVDARLTIEPRPAMPAVRREGPLRVPYEIVLLSGDRLELRYAPDEQARQELFGPAIRRLPPDARGVSRKSLRAGLVPWALDYPCGRTATVYLPDDGQGSETLAEMVAEVERSLLAVLGFSKVA